MYPEVEQCQAAHKAAIAGYAAAMDALERQGLRHNAATGVCEFCDADGETYAVAQAAVKAAWEPLKESADPLVRWIAEHCGDYRDEALMVLRALPAPLSDLDALAEEQGWCATWARFKRWAAYAGVLPGETAEVPA